MTTKKKKALFFSIPFIILFMMWGINAISNKRQYNEEKAALFDESYEASYYMLSEIQKALLVLADYYDEMGTLAYQKYQENYKDSFLNLYYDQLKYHPIEHRALDFSKRVDGFIFFSAVFKFMRDGGSLRKKQSQAIIDLEQAWLAIDSPEKYSYEELHENLSYGKKRLLNSMLIMNEYYVPHKKDILAWQKISSLSQLYIWQRYSERKNWPFSLLFRK